jgi:predicted nucleic acid-binding protein
MNRILLDTNILIYLLQGNIAVRELLEDREWHISFINEMELLMKPALAGKELMAIKALLNECVITEYNVLIKNKAIENGRSYGLKLSDSIILATAQLSNLPLLTADMEFNKALKDEQKILIFVP